MTEHSQNQHHDHDNVAQEWEAGKDAVGTAPGAHAVPPDQDRRDAALEDAQYADSRPGPDARIPDKPPADSAEEQALSAGVAGSMASGFRSPEVPATAVHDDVDLATDGDRDLEAERDLDRDRERGRDDRDLDHDDRLLDRDHDAIDRTEEHHDHIDVTDRDGRVVDSIDANRHEDLREIDMDPEMPRIVDATQAPTSEDEYRDGDHDRVVADDQHGGDHSFDRGPDDRPLAEQAQGHPVEDRYQRDHGHHGEHDHAHEDHHEHDHHDHDHEDHHEHGDDTWQGDRHADDVRQGADTWQGDRHDDDVRREHIDVTDRNGQVVDSIDANRNESLRDIDTDPEMPRIIDATAHDQGRQVPETDPSADAKIFAEQDALHADDSAGQPRRSDGSWLDRANDSVDDAARRTDRH